jgi:hypothetical protein
MKLGMKIISANQPTLHVFNAQVPDKAKFTDQLSNHEPFKKGPLFDGWKDTTF